MPEGGHLDFVVEVYDREAEEGGSPHALGTGRYVQLLVRDSGTGIPDRIRERVFEPFFTTKPEGKGTGMGLAVVYGIVRAHGGLVSVDSSLSRGTTLRVRIPQHEEEAVAPSRTQTPPAMGQGTVLVVDDEEVIRNLASKILARLGYRVITCEDGVAAVEVFAERYREIDLVILDLAMPRMGGRDCLARLKVIDPNVRALVSSGYREDTDVEQLLAGGAAGFLRKPYVASELGEAVARTVKPDH
jgi:CheY-like chemotaxis protein